MKCLFCNEKNDKVAGKREEIKGRFLNEDGIAGDLTQAELAAILDLEQTLLSPEPQNCLKIPRLLVDLLVPIFIVIWNCRLYL